MRHLICTVCLLIPFYLHAQITISGWVKDKKGSPVPFANVYLKAIFDGGSTDEEGRFLFFTKTQGTAVLVVSSLGYQTLEKPIDLSQDTLFVNFTLIPAGKELDEVVVSAGAFEASDEKKGTILKPLDIVTNPSASGDLYEALETLPGVTLVNEQTGLFVRGGEASETKTIIDGALVSRPFFGDVPDIPSRGRFNPFLFKGTLFSTGGYSAEYGQALSSVLILNTEDVPEESEYSINLNMAGLSGGFTKVWNERTALLADIGYSNLSVLYDIVPQNRNWTKPPSGVGGTLGFRHLTEKGGLFKSYLQYQNGSIGLNFSPNGNPTTQSVFQNNNQNLFWNNSYKGMLGKNWGLLAVGAISYDNDADQLSGDEFGSREWLGQGRITMSREFGKVFARMGSEVNISQGTYYFNEFESNLENSYVALYAETDIRLGKKIAARVGIRAEHAFIIEDYSLMPRVSMTYQSATNSMFSLAYGQFYQTPEPDFLRQADDLIFEKATHYILNYQWQTEQRIFRVEAYYKDYDQLVRQTGEQLFNNQGLGFSKGIDVFWRDQKSIPGLTYWISYSLIDAQRLYRDFPAQATPNFVSTHTLSLIGNYQFTPRTRLGMGYSYASGRPYFNPNNPEFLADRTIPYHNLNVSGSYLTTLFGNFTVIYASLRNPLGIRQVFGYRYSEDGAVRSPIEPASTWSFFAGISVSIRP